MKRQRDYSQEEFDEDDEEKLAPTNNKKSRKFTEENKRETSLYAPSFLRLLPPVSVPTSYGDEDEDEKEEKKNEDENNLFISEKWLEGKAPRIIGGKYQPITNRPRFTMSNYEKERYREALPDLPSALIEEIYQSNVPEEIGTPSERCFFETGNAQESLCRRSIGGIVEDIAGDNGPSSFEKVECGVYCLLKNLPVWFDFITIQQNDHLDPIHDEPFALRVVISNFNDSKAEIVVRFFYDEKKGQHLATVNNVVVILNDAIGMLLSYGSKSNLAFSFEIPEDQHYVGIKYNQGTYSAWNQIVNVIDNFDEGIFFTQAKSEDDEGEEDEE
jgi:hypothetical protein